MSETNDPPKILVDDDWKAQARAEKEKLAAQSRTAPRDPASGASAAPTAGGSAGGDAAGRAGGAPRSAAGGGGGATREMPPANFETLLSTIVTQALFAMGAIPDPQTGQPMLHLDLARHHIDMLTVLEDKTRGNLSDEESKALSSTLYELRSRYVQVANAARGG